MAKDDFLYVIDGQSSTRSSVGQFVLSSGGSGGGGTGDLTAYLRRDGTSAMYGNLDMGGANLVNVALLDGIDLPAHVANPDAHHAKLHDYNSQYDHVGFLLWEKLDFGHSNITDIVDRQHNDLQAIGANDHHNQIHNVVGTDHTIVGSALDLVGATAANTIGLVVPSANPLATSKVLKTDATGLLQIKRFEGGDFVKSLAYMQAGTYIQAGTYVSAVTYVDAPLFKYSGNVSIQAGTNIYLDPVGFVSVGFSTGKSIRSPSFVSGFLGSGWQIDQGITAPGTNAEFDNLTIRGRMRVYELLIQRIRATNGSIFVTSVGKAKTVTLVSGDTYTVECEEDHGFLEQDMIRAQQFTGNVPNPLYRCDMRVTAVSTLKIFTAVRENGSDIPKDGMDFVRIGNTSDATRRGGLYLSSDDSNAPFMDVFDGVSAWADWTSNAKVKVRIGKISGITSTTDEYGFIAGKDGFGPTNTWIKASNVGVTFNNVPLRFFNGAAQTGYWSATGTEFWLGVNNGNKKLEWNGATLSIRGVVTIEAGGNAATTTYVDTAETDANTYTTTYAPNKALNNTTVNWATSNTRGGNALDTVSVNGQPAATVQGYAYRAGLGFNGSGQLIQAVQGPLLVGSPVNGLNLTSTYFGFFDTSIGLSGEWTMFMKNDGTFRFGRASITNRIEWNGTQLAGYNTSGNVGWYANSANGKLAFGAGTSGFSGPGGVLDKDGLALISEIGLTDFLPSTVAWYSSPEARTGYFGGIKMGVAGLIGFPPRGLIVDIPSGLDPRVEYGNGIWHKWGSNYYLLWSQGNHGPGSGLHADLLDGYNASDFALLNSSPSFSGNLSVSGNITTNNALIGKYTTSSPSTQFGGAIYSPAMSPNPYGYFEYHYSGLRAGHLMWSASEISLRSDGNRYITIIPGGTGRIGLGRTDPNYFLDVAGEGRITGTLRTDTSYSLKPQASPPGVSAAYGILYVNSGGQLYYIRPNGAAGGSYVAG